MKEEFSERIRRLMVEQGLSQTQLAAGCGLSQSTISKLLSGERGRRLSLKTISTIANVLGTTPNWLMGENERESRKVFRGKVVLVGEGGVGKTSLLRALRGERFIEGLVTTHGIGVEKLELTHPSEPDVTMELSMWDFGGQQIYHATHQFFLTKRSLFVLVWDARHGWEAGKPHKWLDTIEARAPSSPVLIVAAKTDERHADLAFDDLRRKYPQIKGHYEVSNKTGMGIEEFRERLAQVGAGLRSMGEIWPVNWLDAANAVRRSKEPYLSSRAFFELMAEHNVKGEAANVLAQWLHDLGDILYFKGDNELNDTVIMNPAWVTESISKVLESEEVIEKNGILTREHRNKLWEDVDQNIREHFLRLMERFDLSYRTLEDKEVSLVVERLPFDRPDYHERWEAIREAEGCKEISMKFSLNTLPAGIPTWFIARSHRFTTHTHWRMGALFADSSEERHLGLIEAYEYDRYLRLTVRGPAPHNFFALLRDGLELTLARFPGLTIKRTVPCPGHDGKPCHQEFNFAQLQKAIERDRPVMEVQCQETFESVSVAGLLFGLHVSSQNAIMNRIDELENRVLEDMGLTLSELVDLRELAQREFLRLFSRDQALAESHCPDVFALLPKYRGSWSKDIVGQKMVLQLYCQEPGHWHPTIEGGRYEIRLRGEWLKSMGPYIVKLARVMKYAAPVGIAIGGVSSAALEDQFKHQVKLMEELAKKLGEYGDSSNIVPAQRIEGAELRALRALLDEVDEQHEWGGLKKVLTPEGHYLWLCEEHAEKYRK